MKLWASPLLIVVLMVKNEAETIRQTLEPYLQTTIDSILVFDTGSTDGTQEIARTIFEKYKLTQAYCIEEPFIDFATSRNHALESAERIFPEAQFILMPDAEWYLQDVDGLIDFCQAHSQDQTPTYLIRLATPVHEFYTPRLFRRSCHVRFAGVVHELPNQLSGAHERPVQLPSTIFFKRTESARSQEKTAARWQRDLMLLLKEYHRDPTDPRTVFYLAQSYSCCEEWQQAHQFYLVRTRMGGWQEERYVAFYRLGLLTLQLAKSNPEYTAAQAVDYFFTAANLRPHRAEPLARAAEVLRAQHCYAAAQILLERAAALPYPEGESSFVEPEFYTKEFYDHRHPSKALCGA